MEELDDKKEEFIIYLTKQGIDVFNISDRFYNDLCFHFESPNDRDVPMKDRIIHVYPNITLCEEGCENKGVDLEFMKAKCECTFNNLMNKNFIKDNAYGQAIAEVMDILNSLNVAVVQCIKDIFKKEYFVSCIGGFLILGLLFGKICFIFKFIYDGLYEIRKYVFLLTKSYNAYTKKNNNDNFPPKKANTKPNKNKKNINIIKKKDKSVQSTQNIIKVKNRKFPSVQKQKAYNNASASSSSIIRINRDKFSYKNNNIKTKKIKFQNDDKTSDINLKLNNNIDNVDIDKIKELLSSSFDENDFDDVFNKEKRIFCQYFSENFQNNQMFINSFCIQEILRPRALKILILIMTIELYFVINALFYNEEYLSQLFNSKKKDSFFSFVPRRFNQFVYTSMVNGVISYLIGYFFIEEDKIKRIFIRNKNDKVKIMYELSMLVKDIKERFIILVFLSIFLSIICFLYISCFNIVYPYIKEEWIKSSVFILILMQFINLFLSFGHSSIRYLAIKCNSEKMFKLSLWIA